jgi:TldD protein
MTSLVMLMLTAAPSAVVDAGAPDPLLTALVDELSRSRKSLPSPKDSPLYYLSYRVADLKSVNMWASLGALVGGDDSIDGLSGRARALDVMVRVGTSALDNTHRTRGVGNWSADLGALGRLPVDDDPQALRIALWRATDKAWKSATRQLIQVKTNIAVKVQEEDTAPDFSADRSTVAIGPMFEMKFDRQLWAERLKRLSARFKAHPEVLESGVTFYIAGWTSYFVDSEGTRLRQPRSNVRISISGTVKAADGMDLELYDNVESLTPEALPTEEALAARVDALIAKLKALKAAPPVDAYVGPAIITNRAAAVFFHEVLGHRLEGHRQKDADDGQTFTKKMGQRVFPEFMSLVDDPTQRVFGDVVLNGFYAFDEEGQPAQKAVLIDNGVLKGFLMGRSPVKGFPQSNGHGRAQPGRATVARMGNLLVESKKQLPFAQLRAELIAEAKRQNKPYGLLFDEISGGFTNTRTGGLPQAFKVVPLVVTRVYTDGRPDELVRGVDMVGTPLAALERILATGDDFAVFNGYCGAESGWVPVSAVAPSMLVSAIEVERKGKRHERAPLLPSPLAAAAKKGVSP